MKDSSLRSPHGVASGLLISKGRMHTVERSALVWQWVGSCQGPVQSTAGMDLVWAEDTAYASRPEGGKLQWFRIAAVRWEEGDGGTGEVGRTQSWKPSGQVPSVSCRSLLRNESSVEAGW